jgi:EAL and modified HD-GYP domain-containing signal transduction protein
VEQVDVFVARQPIFDRQRRLYAYELLYRAQSSQSAFDEIDRATATAQVIGNTLLTIGLENLLCGKKAFINFERGLLLGGLHAVLSPEVLVIEILESVKADAEVLAACGKLCEQGYALALDGFVSDPQREPLARLAKFIKVDLAATPRPEQERLLRTYRPLGIAMVAQKVVTGRRIPAAKLTCLRLLAEIQQVGPNFERLQTLISADVWLPYSLLLYVNSALFARAAEIRSIAHAMAVLGEEGIRHWAVLAALPVLAKNKPGELVTVSLVRARFCELLARLARIVPHDLAFLMGLFSLLDALTDFPLPEALDKVHAAPAITGALTGTAPPGDPHLKLYQLACRYEAGDWDAVKALAATLDIQPSPIVEAYARDTFWAQQALHATFRRINTRRYVRQSATGELRLLWEDRPGSEGFIPAKLMNASAEGLQLLISEKLPVPSYVSCNDPKLGISGRGRVRYCNYVKGKHLIGVEFRGGIGWRGTSALR